MLNAASLFRTVCRLLPVFFIGMVFFPLATLAFHRIAPFEKEALSAAEPSSSGAPPAQTPYYCLGNDAARPPTPGLPLYDSATVAERLNAGLPTALPAVSPYYGEKTVYLTFDDGPDPENTPAILDILRAHGVLATFFIVGAEAEKYPDILRQTFEEGHAIGNHTFTHVYRDIYRSPAAYSDQLRRTDETIKKVTGVRPRISRAPGGSAGSFTKEYWEILQNQGYTEVGWNISSGDASRAKAAQITTNISSQINKNKFLWSHAIVLMHDGRGHEETAKALPEIIRFFTSQGFEFRVVNLETPPAW